MPLQHQLLAYISDYGLLRTATLPIKKNSVKDQPFTPALTMPCGSTALFLWTDGCSMPWTAPVRLTPADFPEAPFLTVRVCWWPPLPQGRTDPAIVLTYFLINSASEKNVSHHEILKNLNLPGLLLDHFLPAVH